MATNKIQALALRMQRLKARLRDAQQEHDQHESRRAYRAMKRAGLTAADVERLLAQMTPAQSKDEVQ